MNAPPRPEKRLRSHRRRAKARGRTLGVALTALALLLGSGAVAVTERAAAAADQPWMNTAQTPADRASELLAAMTQAEKLAMMHGGQACGYVGCVDGNSRLGIPPLHLQDGPVGAGDGFTNVTQLPAPVAGAASWDTSLMNQYGQVLGSEQWGKGTNVVLAPTINIVRDPQWGRAFESFGEDPYLAGQMGAADIQGIQSQGPMAQVKHYAVYNQETNRNNITDNAIVSDRTEREIYLPAFETSVKQGGADSAMCSYSAVNGAFACENGPLQKTALKGDMGFTGFITSDWGATHSTVASANNGLDMEMPGSDYYGAALTTAVGNGQVSQATIDDHVRRILTSMFKAGLFDHAQTGTTGSVVTSTAHNTTAKQVAQEGSVLLKNTGAILPVAAGTSSIAVIGDDAGTDAMSQGGGSAAVNGPYLVTPYQGIKSRAGSGVSVSYSQGTASSSGALPPVDSAYLTPSSGTGAGLTASYYNNTGLTGTPVLTRNESTVDDVWGGASPGPGVNATDWSAKWTGTLHPPVSGTYQLSLTSDDGSRVYVNGQLIVNNWANQSSTTRTGSVTLTAGQAATVEVDYYNGGGASNATFGWSIPGQTLHDQAVAAARAAKVAVVFVSNFESEGGDLNGIDLSAAQNTLVADVAAANPNTVVVVNSGSAVTMPWVSAVKGVVEAWYPGQEDGNAIASLLFGDTNFSGKLPVTFPTALSQGPTNSTAQWPGQNGQVQYSEGLKVGYRWYDSQNLTPLFPFGFGLSYTTFSYANLSVGQPDANGSVAVGFDVTNSGSRAGAEVPQVYVGQPGSVGEPPKNLRGFTRISLNAGQTQHVAITLDARSFQFWNNGWTNAAGTNTVYVGSSSRDIRLTGTTTVAGGGTGGGTTQTALPRTGWTATASSTGGGDVPANMLDGNAGTRWSSGAPMANGQSFTLDMGAAKSIDQVVMDSGGSASDYARGYQVFTSADGTNFGSAVATGTGSGAQVTATFPATTARYVKVVQTGTSTSWWSIAELNVFTDGSTGTGGTGGTGAVLPRTGWTATASSTGGGDVPANMLDGNAGTRWSSGVPMANGQSFTLDLGAAKTFSKLVMDSGGSASDYARGYQVFTSADGTNFGSAVATGTGSGAQVTATFPATTARYVKVVQTGTSTSWWSITEANLYN
ncbi:glycoside hydrolase family 3 C-terminal domain-containing protein [Streptomyces sp. NBC_01477]|uniref:glycoside hydrolase family 3 C-terminal domain-containing protein n=1 Tax=Streptomyces sp. NBC_01477 TaxID=2976015 RepID=UPI002E3797CF|nr:glycoside hydrolase family 3 C-terminal domain-containing protein [Streptomyces sp. NBC_01477]